MRLSRGCSFAVCLLPLVLAACDSQPNARDPRTQPPLVRMATVTRAQDQYRAFTGVVVARVQSDLGFRVGGKVLERLVEVGQGVKRGQPLMRLDPVDLDLQAQAQQQAVMAATARAAQTAEDERRNRSLVAAGAISASGYDRIKALSDAARADLSAAQAQLAVARNETRYTTLAADVDGVVVDTLAEPGQVVGAGQTVVRLAKAGVREALVQLPETLRPAVGSQAQARLFSGSGAFAPARLRQLSAAADPLTRTFDARYVLEGTQADAPLGSTVTLNITASSSDSEVSSDSEAVVAPIAALHDPGTGPGVWVISGLPSQVSWRPVQVVGISDDSARVKGLQAGEQVVALGTHLLHEGEDVLVARQDLAGDRP
jgi:RND family efflux transporter MFP subunit